jgi:hypothetical protein
LFVVDAERIAPDGHRLFCLREMWPRRFPGDAVHVIDATPFAEDLPR